MNSTLKPVFVASIAILLLTLLLWPVAFLIRRHQGKTLVLTPYRRRLRLVVRLVCLFDLLFLGGFAAFVIIAYNPLQFAWLTRYIDLLSPRFKPLLHTIQIVGWLGVIGTLPALSNAVSSWWQPRWWQPRRWMWSRLGDSLIALACIGFAWFVYVRNMLDWSLSYWRWG